MKYLFLLLILVGCHDKELIKIKENAEKACSCRGGVYFIEISKYDSMPDTGHVVCNDGSDGYNIENLVFIKECN